MKGIFSALLGVFDENYQPDIDGINAVVRHNIEHCKVDGLYVCGSTGENFLINTQAKKIILKTAAEAAKGESKLIAHVGSNIIEETLELSRLAAELSYDAISAVTPYYYKFTSKEIRDYYRYIADNSSLPLIIYNIPMLTGVSLNRNDLSELLSYKNIIGIKYTANDLYMLERLRVECKDAYLYSGFDEMLLSAAVLETDGAIGSTYNIIGHWA
ncbi:MAG TPA: N-acetylneuraminate lyase, partial [Clostridiales bacterium]|nr:N-acetylneuraminate lyase [Clostridiales bacterium]